MIDLFGLISCSINFHREFRITWIFPNEHFELVCEWVCVEVTHARTRTRTDVVCREDLSVHRVDSVLYWSRGDTFDVKQLKVAPH